MDLKPEKTRPDIKADARRRHLHATPAAHDGPRLGDAPHDVGEPACGESGRQYRDDASPVVGGGDPRENRILAALPSNAHQRLLAHLEPVPMPLGQVLHEWGTPLRYVYFPGTSIVSLHYIMEDGASAEVAMVGREGLLGVAAFLGGENPPTRAVVAVAGVGYRVLASALRSAFNEAIAVRALLLRFTQALMAQTAQTAICNRFHDLEQRFCRRLLSLVDRLHSNEVALTQEMIAGALGVRREGVTEAAGRLQDAGLIDCRRGRIAVLDRLGIERCACECYQADKQGLDRLLRDPLPECQDWRSDESSDPPDLRVGGFGGSG